MNLKPGFLLDLKLQNEYPIQWNTENIIIKIKHVWMNQISAFNNP